VRLELAVEPELVRVEVSGEGPGFRLPLSARPIDYFSVDDTAAPPIGWRVYLVERLADDWGVDDEAGIAWFEVDHATDAARRLKATASAERIGAGGSAGCDCRSGGYPSSST
jgi:hypothetical protein